MTAPATTEQLVAARLLRYLGGARYCEIAKLFGRSRQVVRYWCDRCYRSGIVTRSTTYRSAPETKQRYKLRRAARVEAAYTGRPVQEIYREWKCL